MLSKSLAKLAFELQRGASPLLVELSLYLILQVLVGET
jgi:hypothetical protein